MFDALMEEQRELAFTGRETDSYVHMSSMGLLSWPSDFATFHPSVTAPTLSVVLSPSVSVCLSFSVSLHTDL